MGDTKLELEDLIKIVNDTFGDVTVKKDDIDRNLVTEFGMDSIKMVELIVALEEKGIFIADEDLLVENFTTINTIFYTINKSEILAVG